ncbi:hypothetical protein FRC07_009730 [Ceratobasidium sp. 392]|nr:hypothetical protein FRC07_009730 [Ceratobasidium sp. 392]
MLMDSKLDIRRMLDLARTKFHFTSDKNIIHVLNKHLTNKTLIKKLQALGSAPGSKFVYVGGHATWDGQEFTYLPVDYAKGGNSDDMTPQGITSKELGRLLADGSAPRINMILVTDFCYAFNFLFLPYVLRKSNGSYFWEESQEFVSCTRKPEHIILHFTGGDKGCTTNSFVNIGSLFAREFYNAEGEAAKADRPLSLSERMEKMQ